MADSFLKSLNRSPETRDDTKNLSHRDRRVPF
jgi:hypothetical protein